MLALSREYAVHTASVFIIVCAAVYSLVAPQPFTPELDGAVGERVTIEGSVIREPDIRDTFTQLTTKTEVGVVLVRTDRFTEVTYGDTIRATGK